MAEIPSQNGSKRTAVTELPKITVHSDTRDILAHAAKDGRSTTTSSSTSMPT